MTTATLTSEPETAQVGRRARSEPRPFDFRQQNKLSREHVRTLQSSKRRSDGGSRRCSRRTCAIAIVSISPSSSTRYDEYVRELPNPTLLTLLGMSPLPGAAILQLPTDIAYCAVELLLGGKGSTGQPTRAFSDLELQLLRNVIERALPELRYAFEPVVATEPTVMSQESNPQFAQIAAPTEIVIVVTSNPGEALRKWQARTRSRDTVHLDAVRRHSTERSRSAPSRAASGFPNTSPRCRWRWPPAFVSSRCRRGRSSTWRSET